VRDLPERLEELASAYAQLASPSAPGELRRRHQRRRRVTAAAWATLAAVLLVGAVVAGGWVGTVGRPAPGPAAAPPSTKAGTKATTPPSTTRPPRLTGTITRPQEGYRLDLPAGWYAVELSDPKQLALGYGKPGKSAVEVYVRTALTLDPRLTSAADRKAAVLASSPWGPETETFANRPATRATRPDGRRFLTIDADLVGGGIPDVVYQIAWPYRCAPGSACPAFTRLRVLEFVAISSKDQWAEVRPMLERMVANVRPIGNAIDGSDPSHPPCAYGRNGDVTNPHPAAKATSDGGVLLQVGAASRAGLPCHFQGELTLRLVDRLRAAQTTPGQQPPLLPVRNNGTTVALDGDLPEGSAGSGVLSAVWKWTNWCGSKQVSAQVVSSGGDSIDLGNGRIPLPRCTNRAAPSILTQVKGPG
jgi:hypothetical protein